MLVSQRIRGQVSGTAVGTNYVVELLRFLIGQRSDRFVSERHCNLKVCVGAVYENEQFEFQLNVGL